MLNLMRFNRIILTYRANQLTRERGYLGTAFGDLGNMC